MPKHRATANRGARSVLALLVLLALLTLTALWLFDDSIDADAGPALLPGAAVADASPDQPDTAPRAETLAQPSALAEPSLAPEVDAPAWPDDVREITLSGRVVDDFGAPWPNAQVVFAADALTLEALPEFTVDDYARTRTDGAGRFELTGPRLTDRSREGTRGQLDPMLVIAGDGMAWHGYAAEGFRGASMDVGDLVLRHPGASFTLRAVDESGAPLEGVLLKSGSRSFQAQADDDPEPPTAFGGYEHPPTDADGRLSAEHLWPSVLYASLAKSGYEGPHFEVELIAGETTDLGEFTLTRGRTQTGRVVDAAGQPVADARVVLVSGSLSGLLEREGVEVLDAAVLLFDRFGENAAHASTDADGGFELVGVNRALDDVLFIAAAPGFRHATLRAELAEGAPVTLVLARGGTLQVELVSAVDGTPLRDGVLRALQHTGFPEVRPPGTGYNSLARPYVELEVDDGRVADAGPLDVVLLAAAPGHLPQRVTAPRLAPGEERALEIRLDPGTPLHGRALDERGEPVADAHVVLRPGKPFHQLWDEQRQHTDADGRFGFPLLLPGTWRGAATKPGFAEAEITDFASDEPRSELVLSMPRGARVHGSLRDAAGEPVVARWVRATRTADGHRRWGRSDRHGAYALVGLQPGEWRLECSPGVDTRVLVETGDDIELDLTLAPTMRLFGMVTRGDEPLAMVRVEANYPDEPDGEKQHELSTRSRSDGSYALELFEPGYYDLSFSAREGIRQRREVDVQLAVDTRLDVDFGTGALAGRVTLVGSGAPLPERARVVLREGGRFVDSLSPDEAGHFRFAPLPAASYTLHVSAPLLQPHELGPLELAAGEQREGLELQVEAGAVIEGRVDLDDGTDFDVYLHLRRTDGGDDYQVKRLRSGRPTFDFESLRPGAWRLDLTTFEEPLLGHGEGLRGEPGAELPLIGGETVTLAAGEQRAVELTVRSAALR